MDEHAQRTMFLGVMVSLVLYLASLAAVPLLPDTIDRFVSIGLIVLSLGFLAVWYLAVRGGFRLGKVTTRAQRRAKAHAAHEKDKRARLR